MKKNITLSIMIIILFSITSVVFFRMSTSAIDYVSVLIIDEQNDHYYRMQENILKFKKEMKDVQGNVDLLISNELNKEEKIKLYAQLRKLEGLSLNISKEMGFYQEDTTVHLFFEPSNTITTFFEDTRNMPTYINRFVRTVELGLFEQYLTQDQSEIIQKNLDLLKKEVDSL